ATIWIGGRPAGEVLTLWWVVFNRPEDCTPPGCDDDDLFLDGDRDAATNDGQIAAAGVVASYAGGTIVTEDGSAFVVARLEAGHPGIDVILGDDSDGVLSNVPGAEVHLVARSHGPAVAGLGVVQATSHAGGCETLL